MAKEKEILKSKGHGRSWIVRLLLFFGLEIPPHKKWHIQIHKRFFGFVGICMIAFIVFMFGMASYSTSPRFCKSCHIMIPYYQAWATSSHKMVSCVECHYPPGQLSEHLWSKFQALSQVVKYVTRTYSSKPYAEISDRACLRQECHSTRLLEGQIITSKGIRFDHRPHLTQVRRDRRLHCTSCHSQIVIGTHVEVTWNTCFLCHFRGMKHGRSLEPVSGCTSCHVIPEQTFQLENVTFNHKRMLSHENVKCQGCHLDTVVGEGEATLDRCLTCHNQPEKLDKFQDLDFVHTNHITKHQVACFHCHKEIQHVGTAKMRTVDFDCSVCHLNMHQPQKLVYTGKGSTLVENMPSPMYLANVDCIACHITEKNGFHGSEVDETTFVFNEEACVTCHDDSYRGMIHNWRPYLDASVSKLNQKIDHVKAYMDTHPETEVISDKIDEIRENIRLVSGTRGVHNIYYSALVLQKCNTILNELGNQVNVKTDDISDDPIVSGKFCGTMCHASAGLNVPPKTVIYEEMEMPHADHADVMACTTCHTFGNHKDVKFTASDDVCAECH